jgi:hypothetical protein
MITMTMTDFVGLHRRDDALSAHDQTAAPLAGSSHAQQHRLHQAWQASRRPLFASDLSEICSAARRHRSEYLRSLVLGWLSRRSKG